MAKSIIDIEINDGPFKEFKEQFDKYKASLDSMPDAWSSMGKDAAAAGGAFNIAAKEAGKSWNQTISFSTAGINGITASTAAQAAQQNKVVEAINKATQAQEKFNAAAKGAGNGWQQVSYSVTEISQPGIGTKQKSDKQKKITKELRRLAEEQEKFDKEAKDNNAKEIATRQQNFAEKMSIVLGQQELFDKRAKSSSAWLTKGAKASKYMASGIKDATLELLKWSGIVGIFSGLIGAGGLFGINRMAVNAANARLNSQGLGVTPGELNSAAIDYSKALRDPISTLGNIRDAQYDLTKKWAFGPLGVNPDGKDPMALMGPMIKSAKRIFSSVPQAQEGAVAQSQGLLNFFSMDDLIRFKNMSTAEIDAMIKKADADSKSLALTDQQTKAWQDFKIQIELAGTQIENTFTKGLLPLSGPLGSLSDAFQKAVKDFLQSPQVGKWIGDLATGTEKFGKWLSSPTFATDVTDFIADIGKMAKAVKGVWDYFDNFEKNHPTNADNPAMPNQPGDKNIPLVKWAGNEYDKFNNWRYLSRYNDDFSEAAKKYNVDPKLLAAITGTESGFNPNAVNAKSGATGLMQVMPRNAQGREDLTNPHDNIMAGARTLAWALKEAHGNVDEALRFYNGGDLRDTAENANYAGNVHGEYKNLYGNDFSGGNNTGVTKVEVVNSNIPQQVIRIENATGGNAIVSTHQLAQ